MKYKIKHENKVFQILGIVFTLLTFIILMVNTSFRSVVLFWAMIASLVMTVVLFILCFIDKAMGASVKISDNVITITRLFGRKTININNIDDVSMEEIERYRRKPEIHYEYRKKMTIWLKSGKKTVLTDDASEIRGVAGFLTGHRDRKRNEDIPLYQAYIEILGLTLKG